MTYLNASQAGKLLGVAPNTVIRWFKKGVFPNAYKIESTIRIPESDIDELIHPDREAI